MDTDALTAEQVTVGFKTKLEEDEINGYIDDAGVIMTNVYDEGDLEEDTFVAIHKYLTRHLIRFEPDRQESQKGLGNAQKSYSGNFELGIMNTAPGQTAALHLDPTGKLKEHEIQRGTVFFKAH